MVPWVRGRHLHFTVVLCRSISTITVSAKLAFSLPLHWDPPAHPDFLPLSMFDSLTYMYIQAGISLHNLSHQGHDLWRRSDRTLRVQISYPPPTSLTVMWEKWCHLFSILVFSWVQHGSNSYLTRLFWNLNDVFKALGTEQNSAPICLSLLTCSTWSPA